MLNTLTFHECHAMQYACTAWPGLTQANCVDFGINFTLAESRYCSDAYNTRSHECCECVSLAPPTTSQPQTTGLVRVSRHSFLLFPLIYLLVSFPKNALVTVCSCFFLRGGGCKKMENINVPNVQQIGKLLRAGP